MKRFVHDPDCAVSLDNDPDARKGVAPPCSCKDRQRARLRRHRVAGGSSSWGDFLAGKADIGNGNYRAHVARSPGD
jgi:hypothetical protein